MSLQYLWLLGGQGRWKVVLKHIVLFLIWGSLLDREKVVPEGPPHWAENFLRHLWHLHRVWPPCSLLFLFGKVMRISGVAPLLLGDKNYLKPLNTMIYQSPTSSLRLIRVPRGLGFHSLLCLLGFWFLHAVPTPTNIRSPPKILQRGTVAVTEGLSGRQWQGLCHRQLQMRLGASLLSKSSFASPPLWTLEKYILYCGKYTLHDVYQFNNFKCSI